VQDGLGRVQLILAFTASLIIRLLRLTWSVQVKGDDPDYLNGPLIFCFWHGRQAGLLAHPRPRSVAVLSSLSTDGTLQSIILRLLGFEVFRGSSSRGGARGLKAIINALRSGHTDAAFAVDGPRGPLHEVKPGAIEAAQKSGATIIPITTRASHAWVFTKAWDQYELPKPFASVELYRGQGIAVDGEECETLRTRLTSALNEIDGQAV
jgi:lysophospholipid acyltransferase (LPLAT)-like uncharacterized protein